MKYKTVLILALSLLLAGLLAGCQADTVEIGMVETKLANDWRASYTTFTGTKTDRLQAEAGQTLRLGYDVEVSKGTLTIEVQNPDDGVVWDLSLAEGDSGAVEVPVEQEGTYTLVLRGDDAGGSFDLTWNIQ